jgi:hypothetical protein
MNDRGLKEILTLKSRASPYSLPLDSVNSFKDIPESFPIISHSGAASRRTLARIRSCRPRSEKQWNATFDGREKWNTPSTSLKTVSKADGWMRQIGMTLAARSRGCGASKTQSQP